MESYGIKSCGIIRVFYMDIPTEKIRLQGFGRALQRTIDFGGKVPSQPQIWIFDLW